MRKEVMTFLRAATLTVTQRELEVAQGFYLEVGD
jgi:hypothetical protein